MENKYSPVGCEHKLPNSLSSWIFQSDETASGEGFNHSVHVSVCKLCGTIKIGGFRQGKDGNMNRFCEEIDIHSSEAIDAIIKCANFIHEEEVWCRKQAVPQGAVSDDAHEKEGNDDRI